MTDQANLKRLVDRAMMTGARTHMRPVIEKELLHYDILFALDKFNLLDKMTFQGGTALRLCYGAPRYSEDLDFTGGKKFLTSDLIQVKTCLETYLGKRYGLTINVTEPKTLSEKEKGICVYKWQLNVITAPERKDLPQQKIKIEVINLPSYSKEPRALIHNYDFLPDGYSDTLVMTETLNEIMADKLISLVNCTRYVRHRDIWDLRWLKTQGAHIQQQYIQSKINDYKISDYITKLDTFLKRINHIVHGKDFYDEMSRFIPTNVQARTIKKEKFLIFLANEITGLLSQVKNQLD